MIIKPYTVNLLWYGLYSFFQEIHNFLLFSQYLTQVSTFKYRSIALKKKQDKANAQMVGVQPLAEPYMKETIFTRI